MMSSCDQGQTKKMWLSFPFWITINFLADSCYNYSTLSDADRKRTFVTPLHGKVLCDKLLLERWYRFEGDAGTRMPTTPVDDYHCNTVRSGWLNGAQPTIGDGEVIRTVGWNSCYFFVFTRWFCLTICFYLNFRWSVLLPFTFSFYSLST